LWHTPSPVSTARRARAISISAARASSSRGRTPRRRKITKPAVRWQSPLLRPRTRTVVVPVGVLVRIRWRRCRPPTCTAMPNSVIILPSRTPGPPRRAAGPSGGGAISTTWVCKPNRRSALAASSPQQSAADHHANGGHGRPSTAHSASGADRVEVVEGAVDVACRQVVSGARVARNAYEPVASTSAS